MEDDAEFVAQCQTGDRSSFGILYTRYIEKIYRFVYYKTFSKETTEDLVSEVFMKALRNIHSYNVKRGTFSSWLYRIARNTVIDYYRTRKESLSIDDFFDLGAEDKTAEELDAVASLKKVTTYLETLTSRQREIITLRVWEERSYREIADIIGGTEDSIKMAFSRSIRDVREKCGPHALLLLATLLCTEALPFHTFS